MSKIEGELEINSNGQYSISGQLITPGSVIQVRINNEWIDCCIEQIQGNYYPIPLIDLQEGFFARMDD